MKILVTGHKGFIGGHIYNYLKSKNYDVYGYDIGDSLKDIKYDYIIHMAARGLIRLSKDYPYEYFSDGLNLTMKFLEIARKNNSKFIFPSSGSIKNPTNPYSLAKKNSVEWIKLYKDLYNIDYYILKFYNIYGEHAKKGAVYLFTKAALKNETATVYGDGSHVRDYLYVGDVVKLIEDILNNNIMPGEYEVGSGIGTSVNDLIKKIEAITSKKIKVQYKDYIVDEAESLIAENTVIKDPTSLDTGIKKVMECIINDK
ncbi:NAD-dependent epimerase/dehydratase family protein [Picrophilus oshimae]|uniref:dTDP-glucose 4,6-dehydratase n=1 Tax=Picrophilus torridus (strain ATCC 700027 / DSM 9790 / JCM 10055 / NBRC 100828 / KAW 2/3) TaxID=1122961 RepID=Q6L2A5_PICTO|nr:NAD-dependent epimerase/dehydratase family protein [Picrophilus oshimae]AAT42897.1 dTDP-glucose 4,6-dehydratase [Picrophilus oshimae DSM 9789]